MKNIKVISSVLSALTAVTILSGCGTSASSAPEELVIPDGLTADDVTFVCTSEVQTDAEGKVIYNCYADYNENGQPLSYTEKNYNYDANFISGIFPIISTNTHSRKYDSNGVLTDIVEKGFINTHLKFQFDENNNPVNIRTFDVNNEKKVRVTDELSYNSRGECVSVLTTTDSDEYKWDTETDNKDRPVKITINDRGEITLIECIYDDSIPGIEQKTRMLSQKNVVFILSPIYRSFELQQFWDYIDFMGKATPYTKLYENYNPVKLTITCDGTVTESYEYTYDTNGNVLTWSITYSDGETRVYYYTHDSSGNLILLECKDPDDSERKKSTGYEYYPDGTLKASYNYLDDNSTYGICKYNEQGQLVSHDDEYYFYDEYSNLVSVKAGDYTTVFSYKAIPKK